ncbi:MAG: hypothetical protein IH965_03810 [Gemmatimonadetes bacterium]|nr:hypothetical protein [Gemmatimonadota bacterium]
MSEPGFTRAERRLITMHRTPRVVQRWLRSLSYNWEREGKTLRSFRGVVRHKTAHCLEAALAAAAIMEQHGYPPLVLDLESQDRLDHVVFAFRVGKRWGAVGGSRDVGLHGRRPLFRSPRDLASSYYEPYIDLHARIVGYALVDLRDLGRYDWRTSERNIWKVERFLIRRPHRRLRTSDAQYRRLREAYREYIETHPPTGTPHTRGKHTWM